MNFIFFTLELVGGKQLVVPVEANSESHKRYLGLGWVRLEDEELEGSSLQEARKRAETLSDQSG